MESTGVGGGGALCPAAFRLRLVFNSSFKEKSGELKRGGVSLWCSFSWKHGGRKSALGNQETKKAYHYRIS